LAELIKGRALTIKLNWNNQGEIKLVNVYIPNQRSEHTFFWNSVHLHLLQENYGNPDFVLGDFNVTEDPIDRIPLKMDNASAVSALRDAKNFLGVRDEWRHTHPRTKEYTYRNTLNGAPIKSRLDRIYVANNKVDQTFAWATTITAIPTNHNMVSVRFAPRNATVFGNGRWTWPLAELKNETLMEKIEKEGIHTLQQIEALTDGSVFRSNSHNTQNIWEIFKMTCTEWAKEAGKANHHRRGSYIRNLQKDREEITRRPGFEESDDWKWQEAILTERIQYLEKVNSLNHRTNLKAKINLQGEKLGTTWSNLQKTKKPRDVIRQLQIPNTSPAQYKTKSAKLTEIARTHHESLQTSDNCLETTVLDQIHLHGILRNIPPEQKLPPVLKEELSNGISEDYVKQVLKKAKNSSATGLDGCPYELWKKLNERHVKAIKEEKRSFDIIQTLTLVFRDIQSFGTDTNSKFADGWMCPLYKKKDRSLIENYRPITLLNTDYKLLTKALALQLLLAVKLLVHQDQARFIPGRSIFNHIRLSRIMARYAETMEENGAIIALDQEKAYDKVKHDYLWETLRAFNLPNLFTNTVKTLYANAKTAVVINGHTSDPFTVRRGVRQGDPLSCFLFDLAIEPLACVIRNNNNIKVFNIPGTANKLAINLFADNTVIYASEKDDLDLINSTLEKWCRVSGAKFNKEKTEIIQIGTEPYREQVLSSRKLNPEATPFEPGIRITADGDAVRSLGTWIGNNMAGLREWEPVLDKVHLKLEKWKKAYPSLIGKTLIMQVVIGGRTQFLIKTQGMLKPIKDALTKEMKSFLWEGKLKVDLADAHLHPEVSQGGLKLLDLDARNDAIEIMWLKEYLNMTPTRPTWASTANILIHKLAPKNILKEAKANPFLQTWKPPSKGTCAGKLETEITNMLKITKKYNVTFAPLKISRNLSLELPAWHNATALKNWPQNSQSQCLMIRHKAQKIKDLLSVSERLHLAYEKGPHLSINHCECEDCSSDRQISCMDPHKCALEASKRLEWLIPKVNPTQTHPADNLTLTRRRIEKNQMAQQEGGALTFNPSTTTSSNLADCFRIFTDPRHISDMPAT